MKNIVNLREQLIRDHQSKGAPEIKFKKVLDLDAPYNDGIKGYEKWSAQGWVLVFTTYQPVYYWIEPIDTEKIKVVRGWEYLNPIRKTHEWVLNRKDLKC